MHRRTSRRQGLRNTRAGALLTAALTASLAGVTLVHVVPPRLEAGAPVRPAACETRVHALSAACIVALAVFAGADAPAP